MRVGLPGRADGAAQPHANADAVVAGVAGYRHRRRCHRFAGDVRRRAPYSFTQNLGNVGNQLTVYPNSGENITELTERDIRSIRREASPTATVSPVKTRVEPVSYNREDAVRETIYGVENPAELREAKEGRVSPFRSGAPSGRTSRRSTTCIPGARSPSTGPVPIRAVLEEGDPFSSTNPDNRITCRESFSQLATRRSSLSRPGHGPTRGNGDPRRAQRGDQRDFVQELGSLVDTIEEQFQIINAVLAGIAASRCSSRASPSST